MFRRKIQQYIEEKNLLAGGGRVLVALSGGADSVALLRVLDELGYPCEAAHCNFHLRGDESDRDETFVRELCAAHGIPLHVTHFDTEGEAARRKVSIEMAARDLRYAWFEQLRQERCLAWVAVAHHRDDSVETFLLNLVRGAGINGLKGIQPCHGFVVRPLLGVSRDDILDYLAHLQQPYVTDSTNLQDAFLRNKIRLQVLPLLAELNPAAAAHIAETAGRLAEAAEVYNDAMEAARRRVMPDPFRIELAALQREAVPETLLFECLHPLGFRSAQVHEVWRSIHAPNGQSGRRFVSAEWEVLRDRTALLLRPVKEGKATDGRVLQPGSGDRLSLGARQRSEVRLSSEARQRPEVRLNLGARQRPETRQTSHLPLEESSRDEDGASRLPGEAGSGGVLPPHANPEPEIPFPVVSGAPVEVLLPEGKLTLQLVERTADFVIPRDKQVACLDADRLPLPLTVRRWQAGDKFVPFGMKGRKNVSDYLTDRKFSLFAKEQQRVVCAGSEIVWLVGERSDNRFRLTGQTRHVLLIRYRTED